MYRVPLVLLLIFWASAQSAEIEIGLVELDSEYRDLYSDTWVATDALGRELPGFKQCGAAGDDKTVGMFYFTWLGQHSKTGPHDITELLKENPENPQYADVGTFHHWGQPEIGYYTSDSEYAIRRHGRALSDAGVDTIILDVTNTLTYANVYLKICKIYTEMRANGFKTPQIMFLTNSKSGQTVTKLYNEFYQKGLYKDMWFMWQGKPLILAKIDEVTQREVKEFFTFRKCWAWTHGRDHWNWLEHWPQRYSWHASADQPEELSVCVAQHPTSNIGRSHYKGKPGKANGVGVGLQTEKGLYFKQQWQRAIEIDPEFVFVTGWNEWVAQRFRRKEGKAPGEMMGKPLKAGETYFVDCYNQEYSRDIEPMKGGYGDNYYYQLVANIRRYKGVREPIAASDEKTIVIDGRFGEWAGVLPEYRDHIGDSAKRNEKGWGDAGMYVNNTGRNDFVNMKVARDGENVYFYIETAGAITSRRDTNWMLLFIDIDQDKKTGWQGYDFRVNGNVISETETMLERSKGVWIWKPIEKASYTVKGNKMEMAIPKTLLGITGEEFTLDFHWADNMQKGDIFEFALNGDSAPQRRFNYRFSTK